MTTNDPKFGRGVFGSGEDFFAFLRDSFDVLYDEGADRPRMMSIGLHMRLTGHPGRAKALIRFIEYLPAATGFGYAAAKTSPDTGSAAFRRRASRALQLGDRGGSRGQPLAIRCVAIEQQSPQVTAALAPPYLKPR